MQNEPAIVCAADYEALAAARMDPAAYAWLSGGSGEEHTLRANRSAFACARLCQRIGVDLGAANTALSLLGTALAHPLLLAPVALQQLLHPDGERGSARAAAATDSGMVVSTLASRSIEEIQAERPPWCAFQLYWQALRQDTEALLERAVRAGCHAVVLTLDASVQTPPRLAQRLGFRIPPDVQAVHLRDLPARAPPAPDARTVFATAHAHTPRWDDIVWLCQRSPLPVIAKGVHHPDDARRLQSIGIAGLIVSNHGGRALDGSPATLDLLPAIRRAVGAAMPVLLDSGIRSGADAARALALGADAVLLGRLPMYGLAANGELGVAHVLKLLREELELAMAQCGAANLAALRASLPLELPC